MNSKHDPRIHSWYLIISTNRNNSIDALEMCSDCQVVRHSYTYKGEIIAGYPKYFSTTQRGTRDEPLCIPLFCAMILPYEGTYVGCTKEPSHTGKHSWHSLKS